MHDAVQKRSAEMDQQEVLGLKLFFKQLANEYYDMELLTKGIQDKDKVATAKLVSLSPIPSLTSTPHPGLTSGS